MARGGDGVDSWSQRVRLRRSLEGRVVHLVPDLAALGFALRTRRLPRVVRFVEGELGALEHAVRFAHLATGGRRFSGNGLAFRKTDLVRLGARPTIYQPGPIHEVPPDLRWRVEPIDPRGVDWSHEREWRLDADLAFDLDEVTAVLEDDAGFSWFEAQSVAANGLGVALLARPVLA